MIGYYNYTVILTYLSLASGITGIYAATNGKITMAIFFLMLSGLFDMFDGTIAKTRVRTKNEKKFGIQIDSLSDLVCFGVLPTVLINAIIGKTRPIAIVVFIIYVLAALIRLAYFNVVEEERQNVETTARKEYEGLPVTMVAVIIPLICFARKYIGRAFPIVGLLMLLLIAVAFITKIKFKKVKTSGMIVLVILGGIELILLVIQRFGYLLK